jgi:hypothetical protein
LSDGDCKNQQRLACDTSRGVCVECYKDKYCQFSPQTAPGAVCYQNSCFCYNDDQCFDSPTGPNCISNRCRECGPQRPCANGKQCDLNGRCQ